MDDVTVMCGCGRSMGPDALSGRGAFRCGCGARIAVTVTDSGSCGAVAEGGRRCPERPIRESAEVGLFLCWKHLKVHRALLDEVENGESRARGEYQSELAHLHMQDYKLRRRRSFEDAQQRGALVVYYIRIGDLIKIGTTTNLKMRMEALQPDELLATEPGYTDVERRRHQQFDHLRIRPRSERFRIAPELLEHIEMVKGHFGEPKASFSAAELIVARRIAAA